MIKYLDIFDIYNALLRRGELCSPELSTTKLQENGRTQFAPTMDCVEYSIKKPSPRGEGGNAVDG